MPGDRHHLSALDVEDALDGLRVRLSHSDHYAHRLLGVLLFLSDDLGCLAPFSGAASFADDVLDLLPNHQEKPDLAGVDPMLLEAGAETIARLATLEGCIHIRPELGRSSNTLKALAVFQYVRLGSREDANRMLQHQSGEDTAGAAGNLADEVLQHIRTHRPALESVFTACRTNAAERRRERLGSAVFPIVPTVHHTSSRRQLTAGYTRALTCTISGRSRNGDQFDTLFHLDGDSGAVTQTPLSAGRTLLHEHEPSLLRHTFQGTFTLDGGGAVHSGESAGLAMALLYFCETIGWSGRRRQWTIRPDCMLTGAIDENGHVLPVDESSIRAKTAAAFFSDATLFVLPRVHLEAAEATLALLGRRYPARRLEIRGIHSIQEAAADRRIVHSEKQNIFKYVGRQFWIRKWLATAVLAGTLLGSMGMLWHSSRMDPYPHTWTWDATSYVVLNKDAQEVFRLPFDGDTRNSLQNRTRGFRPAVLHDLNGDGFKDLVAIESRQLRDGHSGLIHIVDGRSGRLSRTLDVFEIDLPYRRDLALVHGRLAPVMVIAGDHDQDGAPEIYVVACHDFYPTVLMKIDPLSGQVLDIYHHSGRFYALAAADLDEDGRNEIIATGTNNAFDRAVLVVLDPDQVAGHGPSQGIYQSGPGPTSNEKLYIRLPRSQLGLLAQPPYPVVSELRLMPADRLVQFNVLDAFINRPDGTLLYGGIFLYLDGRLRAVGLGTTDSYDEVWDRVAALGMDPTPLDSTFMADFMTRLERWTPDGWTPHPVSPQSKISGDVSRAIPN